MKKWSVSSALKSERNRRPASFACVHPSGVSLTLWSGIVWWMSLFSIQYQYIMIVPAWCCTLQLYVSSGSMLGLTIAFRLRMANQDNHSWFTHAVDLYLYWRVYKTFEREVRNRSKASKVMTPKKSLAEQEGKGTWLRKTVYLVLVTRGVSVDDPSIFQTPPTFQAGAILQRIRDTSQGSKSLSSPLWEPCLALESFPYTRLRLSLQWQQNSCIHSCTRQQPYLTKQQPEL